MVYNGDISSLSALQELETKYSRIKGVMIGRGLLTTPWLAAEYQEQKPWTSDRKRTAFRNFHQKLLLGYTEKIEGGEQQLLGKMVSFWEYLLANEDRKCLKKIRKAKNLSTYCQAVNELIAGLH